MTEEIAHALILRKGKYLAVKSSKDWYWKFPGGGVKPNETPEQALRRELAEEIGLVNNYSFRKLCEFSLDFKGRNFRFHTYIVETDAEPTATDKEERLELQWQPMSRMLDSNDQAPTQQIIYKKIQEIGLEVAD